MEAQVKDILFPALPLYCRQKQVSKGKSRPHSQQTYSKIEAKSYLKPFLRGQALDGHRNVSKYNSLDELISRFNMFNRMYIEIICFVAKFAIKYISLHKLFYSILHFNTVLNTI